jgi:hypothetical protein
MSATVKWHQDSAQDYRKIDATNSKQAWIWAVGPTNKVVEDAQSADAEIEQHSHYGNTSPSLYTDEHGITLLTTSSPGVFFANMPFTTSAQATLPTIVGTSSIHAKGQPSYYDGLVYTHAILLGVAFVIVFPFGVIGLRWKWRIAFQMHWILQVIATAASYIGLAIAITLSVVGIEYSDFNQGHQMLGLIVVGLLSLQVLVGYIHHQKYKEVRKRTVPSYLHIGLGRIVIYAGMINAIL